MALEFDKNFTTIISYYKMDPSAICALFFCCILSLLFFNFSVRNFESRAEGSGILKEFRSKFCSLEQPTTVLSGMPMSSLPYITSVSYVIGSPQNIPESVTSRKSTIFVWKLWDEFCSQILNFYLIQTWSSCLSWIWKNYPKYAKVLFTHRYTW